MLDDDQKMLAVRIVLNFVRNARSQRLKKVAESFVVHNRRLATALGHYLFVEEDGSITRRYSGLMDAVCLDDPSQTGKAFQIQSISASFAQVLALTKQGEILAWDSRRLHAPARRLRIHEGRFRVICAGAHRSAAIHENGSIVCWNANSVDPPIRAPYEDAFVDVQVGSEFTLALTQNGRVHAWGSEITVPETARQRALMIAAGSFHACCLRWDGSIVVWGSESVWPSLYTPKPGLFVCIGARNNHLIGIRADGTVEAYGTKRIKPTIRKSHVDRKLHAFATSAVHTYAVYQNQNGGLRHVCT